MSVSLLKWCLLLSTVVLFSSACATTPKRADVGPRGALRFECNVEDASLEIDEHHVGPIGMFAEHGVLLRPGTHNVIVKKDGYFTAYELVGVQKDEVKTVTIQLRERPQ